MNVKILAGFAKGVEGVANLDDRYPTLDGYIVKITYPEGFTWMGCDLSGHTEELFYYGKELEFVDSE